MLSNKGLTGFTFLAYKILETEKESRIPLGSGVFTTAKVTKQENVLMEVGEGIIVEKARWGRSVILKGKLKIELGKEIDAANLSLAQVQDIIAKKTPAKKTPTKKAVAKKAAPKKPTAKKK